MAKVLVSKKLLRDLRREIERDYHDFSKEDEVEAEAVYGRLIDGINKALGVKKKRTA